MKIKAERAYSARVSDLNPILGDTILSVLKICTGLNLLDPVRPYGFMKESDEWICDRFQKKMGVVLLRGC
jgi:hypothetical protein